MIVDRTRGVDLTTPEASELGFEPYLAWGLTFLAMEVRRWPPKFRGLLVIHQMLRPDKNACINFGCSMFDNHYGQAIGWGQLVGCEVVTALQRWEQLLSFTKEFAPFVAGTSIWFIADPLRFSDPFALPGRQRLPRLGKQQLEKVADREFQAELSRLRERAAKRQPLQPRLF